jgi:hypothetical protein
MKNLQKTLGGALRAALLTTVLAGGAFVALTAQSENTEARTNHACDYHIEYIPGGLGQHAYEIVPTYF